MGIKPIDLQTLFVKLEEVSKDRALAKEQSALQQDQAARTQVAKELHEDRMVTEVPEDHENERVKDDESHNPKNFDKRHGDAKHEKGSEEDVEIVTDPDMGQHVDLSG